jgi:hypothetical protein
MGQGMMETTALGHLGSGGLRFSRVSCLKLFILIREKLAVDYLSPDLYAHTGCGWWV